MNELEYKLDISTVVNAKILPDQISLRAFAHGYKSKREDSEKADDINQSVYIELCSDQHTSEKANPIIISKHKNFSINIANDFDSINVGNNIIKKRFRLIFSNFDMSQMATGIYTEPISISDGSGGKTSGYITYEISSNFFANPARTHFRKAPALQQVEGKNITIQNKIGSRFEIESIDYNRDVFDITSDVDYPNSQASQVLTIRMKPDRQLEKIAEHGVIRITIRDHKEESIDVPWSVLYR